MRKTMSRLFTAVLMAALMISVSIISVSAADTAPTCDGDHTGWTEITGNYTITEAGNYCLGGDSDTVTALITISTAADAEVKLCMCGKNLTSAERTLKIEYAKVDLVNCQSTGGTITSTSAAGDWKDRCVVAGTNASCTLNIGADVHLGSATLIARALTIQNSSVVNVFNSNIVNGVASQEVDGETTELKSAATGGAVSMTAGTLNMYGGTITGTTTNNGGGVYVNSSLATFNMYGGTITGCSAAIGGGVYMADGEFKMSGTASISNNTANKTTNASTGETENGYGGGVYVAAGTFTMSGGTITGNTVSNTGGSGVYMADGEFKMSGGTITGNAGTGLSGGGVYVNGGTFTMSGTATITECTGQFGGAVRNNATFTMDGGTISANNTESGGSGGGVYNNGTFTMNDGTITSTDTTNYVVITASKTFTMTGGNIDATIYESTSGATMSISGGKFSKEPADDWVSDGYEKVEIEETPYVWAVQKKAEVSKCPDHTIGWTEISGGAQTISNSGNYYLTGDVTGMITVSAGVDVTLCLNGKNILSTSSYAISMTANSGTATSSLTLCNCGTDADGKTVGGKIGPASGNTSRSIIIRSGATVNMNDGITLTRTNTEANGGGLNIQSGGTVNMSGGTITACKNGSGGGVYCAGTFNMTSGDITDSTGTTQGGGVYVYGGTFTMSGGTIENCISAADGGGVYVNGGTFTMSGTATITGCTGKYGGAVRNNATFTMNGGTISANNAETGGSGGGVYNNGTFTMNDGTITSTDNDSNHVMICGSKTFTMTDGKIDAAILESSNGATMSISGGKFSNKTDRDTLAEWATDYVVAEIEDGAYSYKVQDAGYWSTGEYMDYGADLGLGLVLNGALDSTHTVTATGGYTVDTENYSDQYVIVADGIAARNMDKDITFEIKDGDTTLFKKTMSIYEAAQNWLADTYTADDVLVQDMINYGIEAQKVFNNGATMDTQTGTTTAPTWSATSGAGVTSGYESIVGATLYLKDQIELNIYVRDKAATSEDAGVDPVYVTNGAGETITRFTFDDIAVKDVKDQITFTVTLSNGNSFEVAYSVADYVVSALGGEQKDLLVALQKYVDSVIEYTK